MADVAFEAFFRAEYPAMVRSLTLELVTLDGVPTRAVYGMTYLDAASVSLDDGFGVEVQTGLPFWMHRFFALPAPAGTTDVRLLDSQGDELARVPIGDR